MLVCLLLAFSLSSLYSNDFLATAFFNGVDKKILYTGFEFPIFWFVFYAAPLFVLSSYIQHYYSRRAPQLIVNRFCRKKIHGAQLLISLVFCFFYSLVTLVILACLTSTSFSSQMLGEYIINNVFVFYSLLLISQVSLLWILQLILLIFNFLTTPLIAITATLVLLIITMKTTFMFNFLNFTMISRWKDTTFFQMSVWIGLSIFLIIASYHLMTHKDLYTKE